jgi:hypothetical protein
MDEITEGQIRHLREAIAIRKGQGVTRSAFIVNLVKRFPKGPQRQYINRVILQEWDLIPAQTNPKVPPIIPTFLAPKPIVSATTPGTLLMMSKAPPEFKAAVEQRATRKKKPPPPRRAIRYTRDFVVDGPYTFLFHRHMVDTIFEEWTMTNPCLTCRAPGRSDVTSELAKLQRKLTRLNTEKTTSMWYSFGYVYMHLLQEWYDRNMFVRGKSPRIVFTYIGSPEFQRVLDTYDVSVGTLPDLMVGYGNYVLSVRQARESKKDEGNHAVLWVFNFKERRLTLINSWGRWSGYESSEASDIYTGSYMDKAKALQFMDHGGCIAPAFNTKIPFILTRRLDEATAPMKTLDANINAAKYRLDRYVRIVRAMPFEYQYMTTEYQTRHDQFSKAAEYATQCGFLSAWNATVIALAPEAACHATSTSNFPLGWNFPPLPYDDVLQWHRFFIDAIHNGSLPNIPFPLEIVNRVYSSICRVGSTPFYTAGTEPYLEVLRRNASEVRPATYFDDDGDDDDDDEDLSSGVKRAHAGGRIFTRYYL